MVSPTRAAVAMPPDTFTASGAGAAPANEIVQTNDADLPRRRKIVAGTRSSVVSPTPVAQMICVGSPPATVIVVRPSDFGSFVESVTVSLHSLIVGSDRNG